MRTDEEIENYCTKLIEDFNQERQKRFFEKGLQGIFSKIDFKVDEQEIIDECVDKCEREYVAHVEYVFGDINGFLKDADNTPSSDDILDDIEQSILKDTINKLEKTDIDIYKKRCEYEKELK